MQSLPIKQTYRHKWLAFTGIAIYALLIGFMAINSESVTSSSYAGAMAVSLFLSSLLPVGAFCNCVFLTIPFTAVLKLPIEAFSFMTLMQLLLIIRTLMSRVKVNVNYMIGIIFAGIATQIFPTLLFGQTIANIILLSFNLLTFYCTYKLTAFGKINVNHAYLSFTVGVLLAGLIALNYGISVSIIHEYRFCGLWTDANFWGMFCMIGIITCLLNGFKRPISFIILLPFILSLSYHGFLTLSRTFTIVCALMILVTSWSYVKKSILGSILVIIIFCVSAYYAFPYAVEIFSERGFDNDDMTNGRVESTIRFFEYSLHHFDTLLFGIGYNNILDFNSIHNISHVATHNSYADIILEFGLLNNLIIFFILGKHIRHVKFLINRLFTLPGIIFCIIIFYMGTLSMLKYAFLFLFAGVFVGYTKQNLKYKYTRL